MASTRTAKHASRTQTVYEQLRADVIGCRLMPDTRLNIAELALQHSVSPGAVREALSRLTAENLVVAEAQRGFRVSPITMEELRDLTQVRVDIEGQCLRRAIVNGTVDWESTLVAAFHKLSRTPERAADGDPRVTDEWAEAHREYHKALVATCDSEWLRRLRALLYAQSERYRRLSVPIAETDRDIGGEHRAILDAALARDADRAVALLTEHLQNTTRIIDGKR